MLQYPVKSVGEERNSFLASRPRTWETRLKANHTSDDRAPTCRPPRKCHWTIRWPFNQHEASWRCYWARNSWSRVFAKLGCICASNAGAALDGHIITTPFSSERIKIKSDSWRSRGCNDCWHRLKIQIIFPFHSACRERPSLPLNTDVEYRQVGCVQEALIRNCGHSHTSAPGWCRSKESTPQSLD